MSIININLKKLWMPVALLLLSAVISTGVNPSAAAPLITLQTAPTVISVPGQAGTANPVHAKRKILLYNFKAAGEPEKHEYYSFIIPQTMGKNLTATGKYLITRVPMESPESGDPALYNEQIGKLGADYVITGTVTVMPDRLVVITKISDIKKGSTRELRTESQEVGALLKVAIDDSSAGVEQNLQELDLQHAALQNKAQEHQQAEPVQRPFVRFYNALQGLSLNIEGGKFFIISQWDGGFNDSYFVRSSIDYRLFSLLGISLGCQYLSADNKGIAEPEDLLLSQWVPRLSLVLYYPLAGFMSFTISVDIGYAYTEIIHQTTNASSPFDTINRTTRSWDPNVGCTFSLHLTFKPVRLSFGAGFQQTIIFGETFMIATLHGGIGYQF